MQSIQSPRLSGPQRAVTQHSSQSTASSQKSGDAMQHRLASEVNSAPLRTMTPTQLVSPSESKKVKIAYAISGIGQYTLVASGVLCLIGVPLCLIEDIQKYRGGNGIISQFVPPEKLVMGIGLMIGVGFGLFAAGSLTLEHYARVHRQPVAVSYP